MSREIEAAKQARWSAHSFISHLSTPDQAPVLGLRAGGGPAQGLAQVTRPKPRAHSMDTLTAHRTESYLSPPGPTRDQPVLQLCLFIYFLLPSNSGDHVGCVGGDVACFLRPKKRD